MVERRVVRQAVAGPAELAGQRLVHVELGGDGAAAVVVQVVLAAQLALLAQRRQAGRALLLQVTGILEKGPRSKLRVTVSCAKTVERTPGNDEMMMIFSLCVVFVMWIHNF